MADGVYVLGGWQSDFAERAADDGLYGLLEGATLGALEAAAVPPEAVQVGHVANMIGELTCFQGQLGGLVASIDPAFAGLPTSRHEAASASGSVAVLAAMADIESERYDVALVVGAEILRNVSGEKAGELTSCEMWTGREAVGERFPFPFLYGQLADEYERRYGLDHTHLERIGEKNYDNAGRNPQAMNRAAAPPPDYFAPNEATNPPIGGRLLRHDCCRATDGSAAVVLASARYAAEFARSRKTDLAGMPRIKGWGHSTAPMLVSRKLELGATSPYVLPHIHKTLSDAMRRADVADPRQLDGIELHDCFTFSEYLLLDHLGLTEPGKVWHLVEDGSIDFDGAFPVNPSGGLLGGGHPAGATGIRMVLDAARQVTGTAGDYQVPDARNVMTCNVGGTYTTVASFIVGAGAA